MSTTLTDAAKLQATSPAAGVAATLDDGKKHLLLAASGSVATIKLPLIIAALGSHANVSIRIILTQSASHFLGGQSAEQPTVASLAALPGVDGVYVDEDEWVVPWTREANILHIELRRWAHLLAIVPLSANTLAKITSGICDDLLTCVVRAWDVQLDSEQAEYTGPKIMVAPSMNTMMWSHPLTAKQMAILDEWKWFEVLSPAVKKLACGDVGTGAMHEWKDIVRAVEERMKLV
jgi:phosphopantothenoylcysteine decarboxylase